MMTLTIVNSAGIGGNDGARISPRAGPGGPLPPGAGPSGRPGDGLAAESITGSCSGVTDRSESAGCNGPRPPPNTRLRSPTGDGPMARWSFLHQLPGYTAREPIQGEFFSTEAISNTAEALVREGIQNALDAGRPGVRVRVRLFLSGTGAAAARPEAVRPYLAGVWPH